MLCSPYNYQFARPTLLQVLLFISWSRPSKPLLIDHNCAVNAFMQKQLDCIIALLLALLSKEWGDCIVLLDLLNHNVRQSISLIFPFSRGIAHIPSICLGPYREYCVYLSGVFALTCYIKNTCFDLEK